MRRYGQIARRPTHLLLGRRHGCGCHGRSWRADGGPTERWEGRVEGGAPRRASRPMRARSSRRHIRGLRLLRSGLGRRSRLDSQVAASFGSGARRGQTACRRAREGGWTLCGQRRPVWKPSAPGSRTSCVARIVRCRHRALGAARLPGRSGALAPGGIGDVSAVVGGASASWRCSPGLHGDAVRPGGHGGVGRRPPRRVGAPQPVPVAALAALQSAQAGTSAAGGAGAFRPRHRSQAASMRRSASRSPPSSTKSACWRAACVVSQSAATCRNAFAGAWDADLGRRRPGYPRDYVDDSVATRRSRGGAASGSVAPRRCGTTRRGWRLPKRPRWRAPWASGIGRAALPMQTVLPPTSAEGVAGALCLEAGRPRAGGVRPLQAVHAISGGGGAPSRALEHLSAPQDASAHRPGTSVGRWASPSLGPQRASPPWRGSASRFARGAGGHMFLSASQRRESDSRGAVGQHIVRKTRAPSTAPQLLCRSRCRATWRSVGDCSCWLWYHP